MRNRRVRHRREARNEQKEAPRPHGLATSSKSQKRHQDTNDPQESGETPGPFRSARLAPPEAHTPSSVISPQNITLLACPAFYTARLTGSLSIVAFPGYIPGAYTLFFRLAVSGFCLPVLRYVRGSVHGCRSPERSHLSRTGHRLFHFRPASICAVPSLSCVRDS